VDFASLGLQIECAVAKKGNFGLPKDRERRTPDLHYSPVPVRKRVIRERNEDALRRRANRGRSRHSSS
jgi:hypothetical protein